MIRPLTALLIGALLGFGPAGAPAVRAAGGLAAGAPRMSFRTGAQLGLSNVPALVSWPVATLAAAPLARYELQVSRDGAGWTPVTLPAPRARSVNVRNLPFGVLRYRVRAVDQAGAISAWAESGGIWPLTIAESDPETNLSARWTVGSSNSAFGGRHALTASAGETAQLTFTGRAIAWVARQSPTAGEADVAIDGVHRAHIDLRRSTWRPRRIVFSASWSTAAEHTVTVTTTEPGQTVSVDSFVVLDAVRDATLVGAGDIASCTSSRDEATAALAASVEGTVFTTGDNVYPDGSTANFANCYGPSWGTLKSRTRPVVGNHEYSNNPGAAGYFAYFGAAAGPAGKGWYRYDAGTWRLLILSSECTGSACTEQLEWLTTELEAAPHRCVLAMWHKPRFSTGRHGNSTKMAAAWQLLHAHGAELVLTGHDHGYQRYEPLSAAGEPDPATGLREFVIGTGGASLYDFPTTTSLIDVRDNTSHGVLRLSLKPGGYAWQFLPVPGAGFTDSGSASCH